MPQALSFVHPLLMWVLLGLMLYSGYLGVKASQIRQVATAALGPALQKGQDWARGLHIALNGLILALFGWQAITGIAIVNKLLSA
jgi:hypothetical protein